jgi:hypothetical protein
MDKVQKHYSSKQKFNISHVLGSEIASVSIIWTPPMYCSIFYLNRNIMDSKVATRNYNIGYTEFVMLVIVNDSCQQWNEQMHAPCSQQQTVRFRSSHEDISDERIGQQKTTNPKEPLCVWPKQSSDYVNTSNCKVRNERIIIRRTPGTQE